MVNPAGTGSPMRLISARLAPLPPSSGFIEPSPSALPAPHEYTYLRALVEADFLGEAPAFARAFLFLDLAAISVVSVLEILVLRRAQNADPNGSRGGLSTVQLAPKLKVASWRHPFQHSKPCFQTPISASSSRSLRDRSTCCSS